MPALTADGPPPAAAARPVFSLEGRAAPGLYLAAWVLAVAGLGAIFLAVSSGAGTGATVAFVLGLAALSLGLAGGAGAQALQRRVDGRAYAGPSPILVFAAAFGLTLVAGFAIGALDVVGDGPGAVLASVLVSAGVSLGLIGLLVVSPGGLSWREMGLRLPSGGEGSVLGDVAWGIALAIPTLFSAGLLAAVLVGLLGVVPESPIPPARDPVGIAVTILAAVVIAPLWEEAFFRGFVTTAWSRTAGDRAAIVRGAVFFALIHVVTLGGTDFGSALGVALIAFAIRLPVGLVLGWVFLRRRTLVAPVALHAAYNAIPVLLVALGGAAPPS
jgi:membrane protease YdiL (CAAX protease family)